MKETSPPVLDPGDPPPSVIGEVVAKVEVAGPWDYKVEEGLPPMESEGEPRA